MIENTDDSQLKAAYEKKLNKIMEGLKVTPTYSWGDVFSGLEEASEDLRNMNVRNFVFSRFFITFAT